MTRAHDKALASAFDAQAEQFERAPVQADPEALRRLIEAAELPPGSSVLDAGCGPGLVAEALLEAGHAVSGVDLSAEMIERARGRCARFGDRASFRQGSVFDDEVRGRGPFDAAISRYVLHHVEDIGSFVAVQAMLIRPGGALVVCDHTTDPDPEARRWHQEIERLRDPTHAANATPGEITDLMAVAGLESIHLIEEAFLLDFDEWFDRSRPAVAKEELRDRLLSGPSAHGFRPNRLEDGRVEIECWRVIARGVKPDH